ncbi:MAG: hypothetical protein COV45_00940 [Deltaproteobacteria bacterium CG11_big_fil_rev_8_21_14_0_20_47_16]|nr:MAG: hypothetical protein COV45_00940 [Deltaproteobacteria bacterium CG11_big_fil_rev_8_21_14_0_20_47_16]
MRTTNHTTASQDDPLIRDLLAAKSHEVEVIAFGVAYHGQLKNVNLEHGFVTVVDGPDEATLELERIESFRVIS